MSLIRWVATAAAGAAVLRAGQIARSRYVRIAYDWSDTNLPWAYNNVSAWESKMPAELPVVDLSSTGSTFWDKLNNTVNAQSGRFICRLPAGVFSLSSFRLIGSSGNQTYSFGFWFAKLAGFVGAGADKTFIEMAANSMTQAQLDALSQMTQASFVPNNMGMFRLDSSGGEKAFLGGITFRADNQNLLTTISSDITGNVAVPQPAPHQGPTLHTDNEGYFIVSHCRFQGAGKGWMSQPPFEMANVTSGRSRVFYTNCEFDGRISESFDPARPRKCGPIMFNKGIENRITDSWLHHSNISRYAANDQGQTTTGRVYSATRCKAEQITNTQNDGKGGFTNATPFGWESTNAEIIMTDNIIVQDNVNFSGQIPQHLQVSSVGGENPQGGRLRVYGGVYRNNGFPALDGFLCIRATSSYWVSDGYDTTMYVYPNGDGSGTRKIAWNYTGTWPPTAEQIAAAGVSPQTHYLVRA